MSSLSIAQGNTYGGYLKVVRDHYQSQVDTLKGEIASLEDGDELAQKEILLWVLEESAAVTHAYVEGRLESAEDTDDLDALAKRLAHEAVALAVNAEVTAAALRSQHIQMHQDVQALEKDIASAEGEALLPLVQQRAALVKEREDLFYEYLEAREHIVMGYVTAAVHVAAAVVIRESTLGVEHEEAIKASHSHDLMVASAAVAYAAISSDRASFQLDDVSLNEGLARGANLIHAAAIQAAKPYLDHFAHEEL